MQAHQKKTSGMTITPGDSRETILFVDDEESILDIARTYFKSQGYQVLTASNGREAVDVLWNNRIDCCFTDINMPEMDGLTLLSKLSERHSLLKSIIVSAYGDMENIRTAMNRGAFDFITKPVNFADLEITMEKTLEHVAQMRKTLNAIKENNILRMYVDETVLNFMDSKEYESSFMENDTVEATVVFIDICGFTAFSEKESADTVVKQLNNYFDLEVKEIISENGYVDKFIGDALMAVFRGDYHLDRAVDAALAIRQKIAALGAPDIDFTPAVSIGINSGEMVSGNIGSKTLRRLDYTVIGDSVNTAQRFQSIAKPNQIIISEAAYEQIKESFKCEKVGEVTLKNKTKPVVVYEVVE